MQRNNTRKSLRLAFAHKARVGKDTACNYLKQTYGGYILRFAGPVYDISTMIQEYLGKEIKKDPKLLQYIGVGMREIYSADIWVDQLKHEVDSILENDPNANIFISDMRFPNEAETLKKLGFVLVDIDRDNRPMDRDPNHISEIALDNYDGFDFKIDNNDSTEDFYSIIEEILEQVYDANIT